MILCACDPDCRTPAFALFNDIRLIEWRLLKAGRSGQIDRLFPDIRGIIDLRRPSLLVIENQYLPAGEEGVQRFKSVSQLVAARAMITAVFIICNVEYRLIDPFTWQRTLGGGRLGREQLKRRSIIKASDIAGQAIEDHNVADAINIGYFYATRNRLTRKASACVR